MSKREVLAYAITHAPPGVKGGPYEGLGRAGAQVPALRDALRWPLAPLPETLRAIREVRPHARVIRIVRKARPSEASAVEVLREYVRWVDNVMGGRSIHLIQHDMRTVLAASGPDPSEVVRAVEHLRAEGYMGRARRAAALDVLLDTFDAYRKAGGK